MRQDLIDAKVRIECDLRIFNADTGLDTDAIIADLTPEDYLVHAALLDAQEAIDEQLEDDEYATAMDILEQRLGLAA